MELKAYFHFNTNILLPKLDDYEYIEEKKIENNLAYAYVPNLYELWIFYISLRQTNSSCWTILFFTKVPLHLNPDLITYTCPMNIHMHHAKEAIKEITSSFSFLSSWDLPLIDQIEIRVAWLRHVTQFAKIDLTALWEAAALSLSCACSLTHCRRE